MILIAKINLPLRLYSEPNMRGHWSKRYERNQNNAWAGLFAESCLNRKGLVFERGTVKLIRIAPRMFDDDNLRGAFKAVRDAIARKIGIDDRDPRVKYEYDQERGKTREYGVRIELWV
jgi:hypothetical protein